jgi:catechol 2,3-dioxygenase-like lactoylglutathione lyase family enzyme
MKRFHVHLAVADLETNVQFYRRLFGREPDVRKPDYAKWLLDDPRVNFALSSRGAAPGLNHLGFQAEDETELAELQARARAADAAGREEREVTCCYARGNKYWIADPQGIAWEHFHTLSDVPVFGEPAAGAAADVACPTAQADCARRAPACCG